MMCPNNDKLATQKVDKEVHNHKANSNEYQLPRMASLPAPNSLVSERKIWGGEESSVQAKWRE